MGAEAPGTLTVEAAITPSAWSACPGATSTESGHGRRTSRTAHPRTTGAAAHRPGATRTDLGPHTPDRGLSAPPTPSRADGRSASEPCRPSRLLRGAPRLACRRGAECAPEVRKPQLQEHTGTALSYTAMSLVELRARLSQERRHRTMRDHSTQVGKFPQTNVECPRLRHTSSQLVDKARRPSHACRFDGLPRAKSENVVKTAGVMAEQECLTEPEAALAERAGGP